MNLMNIFALVGLLSKYIIPLAALSNQIMVVIKFQ